MSTLGDIPVSVEGETNPGTGNIPLLLNELRHALIRLADSGDTTTIDLRALPLAPGELDLLEKRLGQGEVSARLDALGRSDIIETRYAGVWRITHYNQNEEIMGYFLEVTTVPTLLQTPAADLQDAIDGLAAQTSEITNHE